MRMAKTIMIADKTYDKLKKMKETQHMSFTQLLESLTTQDERKQRYERILALKGTWKDTKEDREIEKEIKEGWKKWTKKYA